MAQLVALLALLKKLWFTEVNSFSSVGMNNFLFCGLFLMLGSTGPASAFWSTLLFQVAILLPLLVSFSIDTQHRLPAERVGLWPLTDRRRLLLSSVSFVANPLFFVLFAGYLLWMDLAVALGFLILSLAVHVAVYALAGLTSRSRARFLPGAVPLSVGGIAQEMWRELMGTLDFWTALSIAVAGTLYRVLGKAPQPEAFPMLALLVGIAMSTVCQRMLRLDGGQSLLRYRLLPITGWKLLLTLDAVVLVTLGVMSAPLHLGAGIGLGMAAIAAGRYPSLTQRANQHRWRFVGGDPRFGTAQIVLGVATGIAVSREGWWVLAIAFAAYVGSVFWGEFLWRRGTS